jgi:polyisoprenoid-binding protein YceI
MRARITTAVALALVPLAAWAKSFTLVPAESRVTVHVGKTGAFSAFAHEHDVSAPAFSGEVQLDAADPSSAKVDVTFDARALKVMNEPKDGPKVEATMRSAEVLDVEKFPRIHFTSTRWTARKTGDNAWHADVEGRLELHGQTRPVTLPLELKLSGGVLTARGRAVLRQTEFGMTPIRLAGGTVRVPDEVAVVFDVTAH